MIKVQVAKVPLVSNRGSFWKLPSSPRQMMKNTAARTNITLVEVPLMFSVYAVYASLAINFLHEMAVVLAKLVDGKESDAAALHELDAALGSLKESDTG